MKKTTKVDIESRKVESQKKVMEYYYKKLKEKRGGNK